MSGINVSAFLDPARGDAVKFTEIGEGVTGVVVDVELVDDTFNPGRQVLRVKVDTDDGIRDLYVRSAGQREAVGKAVVTAGQQTIDIGGGLSVTYTGNKTLGNGKSMKLYEAIYSPPAPF